MTVPLHEYQPRATEDEMVRRVYERAAALRRRRVVRAAIGSGVAVAFIAGGVLLGVNLGTSLGRESAAGKPTAQVHLPKYALAANHAAATALGAPTTSEPTPRLAAGSSTAPAPMFPRGAAQPASWMGLLTNGLKVFESTSGDGQAVVLAIQAQPDKTLTLANGPDTGKIVTISPASGSVKDSSGNSWRFSAIQSPNQPGGTVALQGKCQWQPSESTGGTSGTSQTGSCENVVINLPNTSTTTGATAFQWSAPVSRVTIPIPNP